ncbi:MAG TPA: lipopolysaccharide kinase InaA family protein [Victivallales bacterium]|nr:lipopolysaccharide kinase InaA family protein [Victivallales bacterium]HPO90221.1 lipopolysaccharide kinase InaA family protein [Victivallales bacterium]HRR06365.1 lipopolysaccharide kinase InaA family protein [Victivallales bacterium]HRR28697.1 lipopolysaccharide kinase InaA family protein [Victivallales bacterium]HRU00757.1 lipopolysaccharide kinase InaA family protein [Victivallales bacterium]
MKAPLQQIEWSDHIENEIFSQRGFESFDSFWNLENSGTDIEFKDVSEHFDKTKKIKTLHVTCIRLAENVKYFLKRAQLEDYEYLKNEFQAYNVIGKFGFKTAKLVAFSFNDQKKHGFILVKNIGNAICLNDLNNGMLLPDTVARYQTHEKEILTKLASSIRRYQHAGYFYPSLLAKHIFVNLNTIEIFLIDLENFCHKKELPFYYQIPYIGYYFHKKERKKLLNSLSNLKNTVNALQKLLIKY